MEPVDDPDVPGAAAYVPVNQEDIDMGFYNNDYEPNSYINPLMIPDVLEKILDYTDVDDLFNCRKVCSNWKSESRNVLQKKYIVKFNTVEQLNAYITNLKEIPTDDFPHAMYQFGSFSKRPAPSTEFRRRVEGVLVDNRVEWNTVYGIALRTFFTTFGIHVKKLEFLTDFELPLRDLREILFSHTTNLESLSMTIRCNRSHRLFVNDEIFYKPNLTTLSLRSNIEMIPISLLRDFFLMAPNLQKLTCLPFFVPKKYSSSRANLGRLDFFRVLFHTVIMVPNSPTLRYLTNLDINLQLTETELQGLITKNFPLQYITLGICGDVKGTTLATLLNLGRNLYIKIALNFHPKSQAASYGYNIHLSKLRHLSLCGFRGSLTFVKHCPDLKTLVMAKCGNMTYTFPFQEMGPHGLQELFLQWDSLLEPEIVQRIARCFPKLTTFSMKHANDEVMREVYLTMPFLQKLTVLNGTFTDTGICGISETVHKDITESGSLSIVDPGKLRMSMSIATLTNLRKLRLKSRLITDVSIFLGIGSCLYLQYLHLECPKLTDLSLMKIAKFPHLKNLNLVSCSGLSLEWKLKLRNELKGQGRLVKLELETMEEVLTESQKRSLILPDLFHYYYRDNDPPRPPRFFPFQFPQFGPGQGQANGHAQGGQGGDDPNPEAIVNPDVEWGPIRQEFLRVGDGPHAHLPDGGPVPVLQLRQPVVPPRENNSDSDEDGNEAVPAHPPGGVVPPPRRPIVPLREDSSDSDGNGDDDNEMFNLPPRPRRQLGFGGDRRMHRHDQRHWHRPELRAWSRRGRAEPLVRFIHRVEDGIGNENGPGLLEDDNFEPRFGNEFGFVGLGRGNPFGGRGLHQQAHPIQQIGEIRLQPPQMNLNQAVAVNINDLPPPIPVDMDFLEDIEM